MKRGEIYCSIWKIKRNMKKEGEEEESVMLYVKISDKNSKKED